MQPPQAASDSFGFLLGHTYRKLVHLLSYRLREYDLTTEQFAILYQLHFEDGINQKEIALRTGKDQPTTTRILDALIKKGLVEKRMCKTDRRAFLIFLTHAGQETAARTIPIEQETIRDALTGMDEEKQKLIIELLLQVSANVQQQIKQLQI
ncbi:MarR family winged helix-turn-helix transcriptional regulator [Brevibacillus daliensis]|uniref:MarR family winged helix-turn-helix transcriptional regulator n=1 Tax=Brevibacillus daliensis TaxID=2892995 RepID=UPI001E3492F4|nr:MarR family transcriptional regulator [Brevibacillus daliensis]